MCKPHWPCVARYLAALLSLSLTLALSGCSTSYTPRPTTRPAIRPTTQPTGNGFRYEAEFQPLTDDAEIHLDLDSAASEGQYVYLGRPGSIHWAVQVPEAGRYELTFRYRIANSDRAQTLLVNEKPRGLGFPMTAGEWAEITTIRQLNAGTNSIELRANWGEMDVDLLRLNVLPRGSLAPVVEYPVITPRRNTYYRGSGDPRLKLDLGGHHLLNIAAAGQSLTRQSEPFEALDDATIVNLPSKTLDAWPDGTYPLTLRFDGGIEIPFELQVQDRPAPTPWTIVAFNVGHGASVFMRLPNGKTALIDTGTAQATRDTLLPFLQSHGINTIDYLILTHYHDDHGGGVPILEQSIRFIQRWDYKSLHTGDNFDVEGLKLTVLNAYDSGTDENSRSLCLRFEYNGFVYLHGGDTYGQNQVQMLKQFPPETLRAQVFHANHHLHGSIDVNFYRTVDPALVLVSAEEALYARGAFTTCIKQDVETYLKSTNARLREPLLTQEVGHIIVRIQDSTHWTYETTPNAPQIPLP